MHNLAATIVGMDVNNPADDPQEVAAEKQRRLLEMTPAKNAPVSA